MTKAKRVGYSIFPRGGRLYASIAGPDGKWIQRRTKFLVGQEDAAEKWGRERAKRIAADRAAGAGTAPLTVEAFSVPWLERRRALVADAGNDEQRLRSHVLPVIGSLMLGEVEPRHVIDLFADIRGARKIAPRTIYNVYSVVSALFRDARKKGLISQTPCILDAHDLGPKVDSDPTQRGEAVFTREEVEWLLGDRRIPFDRRVVYALEAMTGLRHGEVAGLRWRHYDASKAPLGMLTIATSYDKGATKTGVVRRIPVHPTLAAMLTTWRGGGWPVLFGHEPGPDDLVVPLEPDPIAKRARKNPRAGGMRSKNDSRKRWLVDLVALGLRHRRGHDLRATFITLAVEAGADLGTIERLTHTAPNRKAIDGYWRAQWPQFCREVMRLEIVPSCASHVQAAESATMTDSSEWRRRESKAGETVDGDALAKVIPIVAGRRAAPDGTDSPDPAHDLVQRARCDAGLIALTAAVQATRRLTPTTAARRR